jgi:hypothetical protein
MYIIVPALVTLSMTFLLRRWACHVYSARQRDAAVKGSAICDFVLRTLCDAVIRRHVSPPAQNKSSLLSWLAR